VGRGQGNSRYFKVNQIDCGTTEVTVVAGRRYARALNSVRGSNTSLVVIAVQRRFVACRHARGRARVTVRVFLTPGRKGLDGPYCRRIH
jgi:hypothetical protein